MEPHLISHINKFETATESYIPNCFGSGYRDLSPSEWNEGQEYKRHGFILVYYKILIKSVVVEN